MTCADQRPPVTDGQPIAARPDRGLRGYLRTKGAARFGKFLTASLLATAISQLTLMLAYGVGDVSATVAGLCAFVAGAIPNFLLNRRWAWQRTGRPAIGRELLPYLAVIVAGGLATTALITLSDNLLEPVLVGRGWRTLALDGAYVASYGLFFVVKYLLLDRLVFRGRAVGTNPAAS